jgi:hypothetical protein
MLKNFKQCRQELDRAIASAKSKKKKYIVKIGMKITKPVANQIKEYYEKEFGHVVNIEYCSGCGEKRDIVIFIRD